MEKYKLMLEYTFFFFVVSLSMIILAANMAYETNIGRQEKRPSFVQRDKAWAVEKTTKGVPPVRIVTKTEWRQQVNDNFVTNYTREIHWGNIVGVVLVSAIISGILIFITASVLVTLTRVKLPMINGSGSSA